MEENIVCRLCFRSYERDFKDVKAVTIELLRILKLDLHLDVNGKSVICKTCSDNLQLCFDFKTICICTENCINSFINDRNNVKLDLREVYLRKRENENVAVPKYDTICRLCMEMIESSRCIPLDSEIRDIISAKTILRRYFSELDLDITKNPQICASCNGSLHSYCKFIRNCLAVKDEIPMCREIEGGDATNHLEPSNGMHLGARNISNNKNGCSGTNMHKDYNEDESYHEIELKFENTAQEELQELQIKNEVNENDETENVKVERLGDIVEKSHDNQQSCEINSENVVEVKNNMKHEEINIKNEEKDTEGLQNNMLIHKNPAEEKMHSCELCTYKAKYRCLLKKHMLVHKKTSDVTMYTCEMCTYKTQWKSNLTVHMLVHKKPSDVVMYSCEICTYKVNQKNNLRKHMLVHKDTSEVTVYSCEMCTYKSKYKSCLKQHILFHRNTSEITMYSCELCTYKAKQKGNLKSHIMLNHKNTSEVTMYSCEICTYKSKYKSHLKEHTILKHASEIKMYSCEICTYKSKYNRCLKQHMLIHKDSSGITVHLCEVCGYKTAYKYNLKKHMLIHRKTSENKVLLV